MRTSPTLLTLDRYFELLASETEQLASALESALEFDAMSAPVQACPEWTLADLGYHVGDVTRFWTWVVSTGATSTAGEPEFVRPSDAQLADWVRVGVRELIATLAPADPSTPAYSWTPQQDVAFVQRRVPHEVAVHRWDAEHAARHATNVPPRPIAYDLASDGVSEFFLLASSWPVTWATSGAGAVRLLATDTNTEWTAWVDDSVMRWSTEVSRVADDEIPEVVATLSGPASDLLLTLWRRLGLDESAVRVDGDAAPARQFLALANLD
ncbi:MAG TPA: maleylpyruvate isomerase N-terminal domain-containing protein [Actinomycetes bacterium]|nr:maleylpyruvate isomerase N-terminal domain-containing protein [Actinomycetes bacterium]